MINLSSSNIRTFQGRQPRGAKTSSEVAVTNNKKRKRGEQQQYAEGEISEKVNKLFSNTGM
jgi:hypothetical protein